MGAPFLYRREGRWIEDSQGNRLLDLRGWGYLTGKGAAALGLDEVTARNIQDAIGRRVALLMNCDSDKSFRW